MSETEKVQDQTTTNSKDAIEVSDQVLVPSGRTSTSKNALVHGLYASDIILPWKSEEVFACLFRELKAEFMPSGRQQMETVLSIARLNFLKHRLMRSTQLACRNDPFLVELEKAGAKTWADVSAVIQQKATAQDTLRTDMQMASQELTTALKNASDAMTADDKDSQEIWKKVEFIHDIFHKFHDPLYKKVFDKFYQRNPRVADQNKPGAFIERPETLVEQAYHPDYLEKLVRLEASIDARIDKLLQRLVTLQEYRRFKKEAGSKTIPQSPSGQNNI